MYSILNYIYFKNYFSSFNNFGFFFHRFTGLDFLADGGADFEHAITVTGKSKRKISSFVLSTRIVT